MNIRVVTFTLQTDGKGSYRLLRSDGKVLSLPDGNNDWAQMWQHNPQHVIAQGQSQSTLVQPSQAT